MRLFARRFGTMTNKTMVATVVCTESHGLFPSVMLVGTRTRYLFNTSESAQRAMLVQSMRGQVAATCYTSLRYRSAGGLAGWALTMFSKEHRSLLAGPAGLYDVFNSYAHNANLKLEKRQVIKEQRSCDGDVELAYADDEVKITSIAMVPSLPMRVQDNAATSGSDDEEEAEEGRMETGSDDGRSRRKLRRVGVHPSDVSLAFVVQGHKTPPKFDNARASELGVPFSGVRKTLLAGEPITLEDGRVIRPEDVMVKSEGRGINCLVCDCPTVAHLDTLSRNVSRASGHLPNDIDAVFHMAPASICTHDTYLNWIRTNFPSNTAHVFAGAGNCDPGIDMFVDHFKAATSLSTVDPDMLPPPYFHGDMATDWSGLPRPLEQAIAATGGAAISALPGLSLRLFPRNLSDTPQVESRGIFPCDRAEAQALLPRARARLRAASLASSVEYEKRRARLAASENAHKAAASFDFRVTFLGTSSSLPTVPRNVSAILVDLGSPTPATPGSHRAHMLLDCGEGTVGQILRLYGPERTAEIMASLDIIYISHTHADHHLGLVGVIEARTQAMRARGLDPERHPLALVAPRRGYVGWKHLIRWSTRDAPYRFYPCHTTAMGVVPSPDLQAVLRRSGLNSLVTTNATHIPDAHCVRINHRQGWSVFYSGDTRPNKHIPELGSDCTLSVFESTFTDEYLMDARQKGHSTVSEAVGMCNDMNAAARVLTHFSSRYGATNIMPAPLASSHAVGIAADFLSVHASKIPELGALPVFYEEVAIELLRQK